MRTYHSLFRGFLAASLGGISLCLPAFVFAQTQFKIDTLTTNNVTAIEAQPAAGDDRSGIAVSPTKAFLTGDNGTGAWDRDTLTGGVNVGTRYDSIVMDIHTEKVYTLADSGGSPIQNGGGTVTQLVELDPDTGALTGNAIALSESFSVSSNNFYVGIFSGYDRIVVVNGVTSGASPAGGGNGPAAVYNIDLPGGTVSQIGTLTNPGYFDRQGSENWATWGVAEFFDGDVWLAYTTRNNNPSAPEGGDTARIDRINVRTNVIENVVDFSPQNISDSACFTVVPSVNRWYFHYEGSGFAGSRDETLGFADASFIIIDRPALVNISTRAQVGTGANVAIAGFILQTADQNAPLRSDGYVIPEEADGATPAAGSKRVLIRGLGPSINSQTDGMVATLPNPVLELYNGNGNLIAYNNNWKDTQRSTIMATGVPPQNDLEAAMVVTLVSNSNYTTVLRDRNNGTGVGLVEVYDLQGGSRANLANISTRAVVSTGDNVLIGGILFSEGVDTPGRVVLRAIGPSLTSAGVAGALQDPTLELADANGMTLAMNDNWMDSPDMQEISDSGLAPTNAMESAIIFTPDSGAAYTAIVRGVNGTTGTGLVEAYQLPPAMMRP